MPVQIIKNTEGWRHPHTGMAPKELYVITDRKGVVHTFPKLRGVRPHVRKSSRGKYWNGRWIAEYTYKGKRKIRYCDSWEEAAETKYQIESSIEAESSKTDEVKAYRKREGLTLRNAVEEYLLHCKHNEGLTEGTMHYKRRILNDFVRAFAKQKLASLTNKEISRFLQTVTDPNYPSRFNRYRKEINALYNHGLEHWDEIQRNPVKKIKKERRKKSRISHIPTSEELNKVIKYAKKKAEKTGKVQIYNLLIACRDTWGRKMEILRWTWKDHVDFNLRRVRMVSGKASYDRADTWIPMTDDLETALKSQLETSLGGKYVFECRAVWTKNKRDKKGRKVYGGPITDGSALIVDICKAAGVKPFNFHAIRHNRISNALKNGKPIHGVRNMARHHSISITNQYSHFDDKELLDIIE